MKNAILAFIGMSLISACTVESSALKGQYSETPYEIITEKPLDTVWSNIIDLFAQKGLAIKVIDKSSGLITSEKTSFLNSYTYENASGGLENPNASVVITRQTYGGSTIAPQSLTGEWNVRIKPKGENTTSININITNIQGSFYSAGGQYSPAMNLTYEGKSTGKFESVIAGSIK